MYSCTYDIKFTYGMDEALLNIIGKTNAKAIYGHYKKLSGAQTSFNEWVESITAAGFEFTMSEFADEYGVEYGESIIGELFEAFTADLLALLMEEHRNKLMSGLLGKRQDEN